MWLQEPGKNTLRGVVLCLSVSWRALSVTVPCWVLTVGEREMQGLRTPHSAALRGSTRVRTTREAGGQREWQSLSTQQAVLGD